jgi:hypothetical protein
MRQCSILAVLAIVAALAVVDARILEEGEQHFTAAGGSAALITWLPSEVDI